MKKQYRKSIKRRIQNALMKSSLLSIGITVIAIVILLGFIVNPIGHFFTTSVNSGIVENFTMQQNMQDKVGSDSEERLYALSYQALKNIGFRNTMKNTTDEDMVAIQSEIINQMEKEIYLMGDETTGDSITVDEKKALLVASIETLESMDKVLTFGDIFGFDWVQISLVLFDGEESYTEFQVPHGDINFTPINKKHEITSQVNLFDSEGQKIGYISTVLNPSLIVILVTPVIFIFILIAVLTFIIVKIVLTPSTFKLVKPIKMLNKQLYQISENEVIDSNVHIEMKKPPKEIYELITYSNIIMEKLNESQELMYAQNQELEAQRDVLESQRDELEAQNEELDIQNEELMHSQMQLKQAQDRLVQSEKLASMGQLTAAIAHEINTPLGAVSSNSQLSDLMLMKMHKAINDADCEEALKMLSKLKSSNKITLDAANRVNEIIRNLRNFSRIDQAEFQNADVREGIKSVLVLTSNLWKNKLTIHEHYDEIPNISCYPSMLNQVFMNVIVNAIQATEKDGQIEIETIVENEQIKITIKDDGCGIPEALVEKIFESGFTTKPKDAGTGLGLSISRDIINKHHGTIRAFNNEGKGATFEILLPVNQVEHDETCNHD